MSSAQEQSIRTICGFCHTNCGLIVRIKNDVIQSIRPDPQHPVNMGGACPKGLAGKEVVYAPERLLHPLRKTKSGFEKVSWDTALDIIAHKLLNIKNKHGGEAIVRGIGAPITEENRDGFSQLLHSLGSPNTVGTGHVCHQPRSAGFQSVFGHMPQPDYASTSLILLWGTNPLASRRYGETGTGFEAACGRFSRVLTDARKRGAILIVIDPWRNA
ncbi:MAG TPA: molybdopterin-dependent oxidoreductase, partial [Dehalococcoidia bacterium]|nr:molybdopterin-dependent oxidoreductase [Dehalococcoidia bacterium]